MTRINIGIPPRQLTDKHLLAEHREIKRIPNALSKFGNSLNIKNLPKQFKMGEGHVRFFYDKGKYTFLRYIGLHQECRNRGFNVTDFSEAWNVYNKDFVHLFNEYIPTEQDKQLIIDRLIEKDNKYKQIFNI